MGRQLLRIWLDCVVRFRAAVVFAALLISASALWYVANFIEIDTDTTEMISVDVPFRQNDQAYDNAFPHLDDSLLIVLDGGTPESRDNTADQLIQDLRRTGKFRDIYRPDESRFLRQNALLYLPMEELETLSDRLVAAAPLLGSLADEPSLGGLLEALDQAIRHFDQADSELLAQALQSITEVAASTTRGQTKRLSWRQLLAPNGEQLSTQYAFISAQPELDHASLAPAAAIISEVRELAQDLGQASEGVRLRLTGSVALEHEELESAEIGGKSAAGLSLALVSLLLVVGLRSFRLVAAAVFTLIAGLIWTAAFATLAIGHLNLISVAFAVLFVGLAVDFSIHFCLRYRELLASAGSEGGVERRTSLAVGRPLIIGAVAAAFGFYAFWPTDYRGFAELGLISGTSMFIALFLNLTLLPALLSMLKVKARHALPKRDLWQLTQWLVSRHHRPVLFVTTAIALGALALLPLVRFDFNPVNLKDPATESFSTFQDLAALPNSAVYAANLLQDDLAGAVVMAGQLKELDSVANAVTLASFVPVGQEEKLVIIDNMALFLAPLLAPVELKQSQPNDLRQALATFASSTGKHVAGGQLPSELSPAVSSLQSGLVNLLRTTSDGDAVLAEFEAALLHHLPNLFATLRLALSAASVTVDDIPGDIIRHWVGTDGRYRVQVLPAEDLSQQSNMEQFVAQVLAAAPSATGTPIIISEASRIVVTAFVQATSIALAAVLALLFLLYRKPALVVLTMLPLFLAAILTLAASVIFDLSFNFANVIVLPLLFGLGVSSSVHLVERQRGLEVPSEIMQTTAPRAVLFSTLTTLASFGSLAISPHRGMSSMGLLLTIAIAFTLVCTIIVLPSMRPLLGRWLDTLPQMPTAPGKN